MLKWLSKENQAVTCSNGVFILSQAKPYDRQVMKLKLPAVSAKATGGTTEKSVIRRSWIETAMSA